MLGAELSAKTQVRVVLGRGEAEDKGEVTTTAGSEEQLSLQEQPGCRRQGLGALVAYARLHPSQRGKRGTRRGASCQRNRARGGKKGHACVGIDSHSAGKSRPRQANRDRGCTCLPVIEAGNAIRTGHCRSCFTV